MALLALMLLDSFAIAQQDHVIDWRTSDNFRALYDAGLQPWKGNDYDVPKITDQAVSIWLPNSQPFRMSVDRSSFGVLKGDALSRADFHNKHAPIEEAVATTKEIAAAIGASAAGLDEAVKKARTSGQNEGWGVDITKGQIDVRLVCEAQHFPRSGLRGNVNVFLDWKRTSREVRQMLRDEPVKPPPGYEHLSMSPPPLSKEPWPKHDLQYYKDLNKQPHDQQKAPTASAVPPTSATPSTAPSDTTPRKVEQKPESSSWLSWLIGIAILLAIIVGGVVMRRKA